MASEKAIPGLLAPAPELDEYPSAETWQTAWALAHSAKSQLDASSQPEQLRSTSQATDAHGGDQTQRCHQGPSEAPTPPQDSQPPHLPPHSATAAQTSQSAQHMPVAHHTPGRPSLQPWPLRILRSSQLDAQRLDVELLTLLKEQLLKAFMWFQPANVADWEPELNATLRLLVFSLSVMRGQATPGSQLLNLKYRSEPQLHANNPPPKHKQHQSAIPPLIPSTAANTNKQKPTSVTTDLRTGVEGAGLGLGQKLFLGFGMVLLPYIWVRLGSALARASAGPSTISWADLMSQEQQGQGGEDAGERERSGQQPQQQQHVSNSDESQQYDGQQNRLGWLWRLLLRSPAHVVRVVLGWCRREWRRLVVGREWRLALSSEVVWRWMQRLEGAYRAITLVNLLVFLGGGRYRSVLERLAGARLVYQQPVMTRIISFEYLNRQLVWQEVSELLLFALPLLDGLRTRGTISRLLPRLPDPRTLLTTTATAAISLATGTALGRGQPPQPPQPPMHGGSDAGVEGEEGEYWDVSGLAPLPPPPPLPMSPGAPKGPMTRPSGPCPVCGQRDMLVPMVAVPCGHCYCYYCLASNTAADRRYECPCDGVRVAAMERWKPGMRVSVHV